MDSKTVTDDQKYRYPDGFGTALEFANRCHGKDIRKGTAIPYITHPVIVAETLAYYYPDSADLIAAGVLHDVVEDTDATIQDIGDAFGEEVARLVAAVTKPTVELPVGLSSSDGKAARWTKERDAMIDALAGGGRDVLRLKAADSLANLRAIRRDLETAGVGEKVWGLFKVGREQSLGYYRRVLANVERLGDEPIVGELRRAFEEVSDTAATETSSR